jgi:hypothetical protein
MLLYGADPLGDHHAAVVVPGIRLPCRFERDDVACY